MAIVPVANNVSLREIRDVINRKAIVLGIAQITPTSYNMYNQDRSTGQIVVKLKNIESASIGVKVDILKNGSSIHTHSTTLANGQEVTITKGGLSVKTSGSVDGRGYWTYSGTDSTYQIKLSETSGQNRQETIDANLTGGTYYDSIFLRLNFPIERISIAQDVDNDGGGVDEIGPSSNDVTSNYARRNNVSIPRSLPASFADTSIGQWRGTQVIEGTARVISTRKGRYIADTATGSIQLRLDDNSFSTGTVTVTIPNVKSITKNLYSSNTNVFNFTELRAGTYNITIKDNLTGNEKLLKYEILNRGWWQNYLIDAYVFNGTDFYQGF